MNESLFKTKITLFRIEVNIPELSFIKELREEGYIFEDIERMLVKHTLAYIQEDEEIYLYNHSHAFLKLMLDNIYISKEGLENKKDTYVGEIASLISEFSRHITTLPTEGLKVYSVIMPDTLVVEEISKCNQKDTSLTSPWWGSPFGNILKTY